MKELYSVVFCLIGFSLALIPVPAGADITPVDYHATPTGGGVSPKSPHPFIRLEAQEVIIRLKPGSYTVDAAFRLYNSGETSTEWIGFPKNAMGRQPGPKGRLSDFIRFEVSVNDRTVPFKEGRDIMGEARNPLDKGSARLRRESSWLVGQATFPGHALTPINVRYEARYDPCGMNCARAEYIYGTGGYWKDGIGKASFIVDSSEQGGVDGVRVGFATPVRRYQISANVVRYEFRDLRPDPLDSLSLTLVRKRSAGKDDKDGLKDALHHAVLNGRLDQVKALLDKGADVNAQAYGSTALAEAAGRGHLAVVKLLVDKGANVSARTKDGRTALAATMGDAWRNRERLEVARFLVSKGAKPMSLEVAAFVGDKEAVERFLAQDSGLAARGGTLNDPAPLRAAASGGQPEIIKLLLDKGFKVDAKDRRGETPLVVAAAAGHAEVVRLLLDRGANIHAQDANRRTALNHAVFLGGHVEVTKVLLDRGANINARDDPADRTILMHAAQGGFLELVELLADRGADVNARDASGKTAMSLARGKDIEEIEKVLKAHGAKK